MIPGAPTPSQTARASAAVSLDVVLAQCDAVDPAKILKHSCLRIRTPLDIAYLFAWAIEETEADNVLEIGTFHGATAALLHLIHDDIGGAGDVVTVDVKGASPLARRLWGLCEIEPVSVKGRSSDAPAGPYGVVFVDGDHTPAGVQADITALRPRLAEKAVVIFDDVNYKAGGGAVCRMLPGFLDLGRFGVWPHGVDL